MDIVNYFPDGTSGRKISNKKEEGTMQKTKGGSKYLYEVVSKEDVTKSQSFFSLLSEMAKEAAIDGFAKKTINNKLVVTVSEPKVMRFTDVAIKRQVFYSEDGTLNIGDPIPLGRKAVLQMPSYITAWVTVKTKGGVLISNYLVKYNKADNGWVEGYDKVTLRETAQRKEMEV